MVVRQPAVFFAGEPPHPRRKLRASSLAVAASVGVHAVIGLYLVQMTFHPLAPPEPTDPPVINAPTIDLPRPITPPAKPPPRIAVHAVATRPTADMAPLVTQPTPTVSDPAAHAAMLPLAPMIPQVLTPSEPPPTPMVIANPGWLARPGAAEMSRAYPPLALRRGLSGSATLACAVLANGAVSGCAVEAETPAGAGFGKAALALTRYFRLRPRTENGAAVGGAMVKIPIRFVIPGD